MFLPDTMLGNRTRDDAKNEDNDFSWYNAPLTCTFSLVFMLSLKYTLSGLLYVLILPDG
jgi:hypothetical protein